MMVIRRQKDQCGQREGRQVVSTATASGLAIDLLLAVQGPGVLRIVRNALHLRMRAELEKMARRGALIVFEGCDRVGKSTQCQRLVEALKTSGRQAESLSFPSKFTCFCC